MAPVNTGQASTSQATDEANDTGAQMSRSISWRSAFILSLGSALLVTVSLGPMAAEIGAASTLVWGFTALIGLLQCLFLAELASIFPRKVGGAPAYTYEGFKHISPLFGAVSTWGYWVGWIPGVAVNLTLAATYVEAAFLPGVNIVAVTLVLVVALYALNYFGLRLSVWLSGVVALCALVPLLVILAGLLFRPSLWQPSNFTPLLPEGEALPTLALLAKWAFVAVWASYGSEMVATIVGELRDPNRDAPKALGLAAAATLLAFAAVPTVLLAIVGVEGLSQDPYVVFSTAATLIFGSFGASIVNLMLIAALILGAEMFIISSSRALYQMGRDGLAFQGYGRLNKHHAPVGSVVWDALITLALLAIFRDSVVNVVAAANVGYLIVFVLLPLAYVLVKTRQSSERGRFRLPSVFIPVALIIAAFNALLFVIGGVQWGAQTMGVGLLLVLTFVPFYLMRDRVINRPRRGVVTTQSGEQ